MLGSLGVPELIFIFVIALLIFGPRKLPEIGRTIGKSLAEFRKASNELRRTINAELIEEELRQSDPRPMVRETLEDVKKVATGLGDSPEVKGPTEAAASGSESDDADSSGKGSAGESLSGPDHAGESQSTESQSTESQSTESQSTESQSTESPPVVPRIRQPKGQMARGELTEPAETAADDGASAPDTVPPADGLAPDSASRA